MATKIIFSKKKTFKDAILITGLPGIGLVGKIAIDYLIKQLKPEKIGEVYSDSFPPSVHTKDALLELIKDEFYFLKQGSKDYLFLAGPVQPTLDFRLGSAQEHYEFAEQIVESLKKIGASEIYTLAGINIGEQRMAAEPKVIVVATDKKLLDSFKQFGAVIDKADGLVSGAAGLILGLAKEQGLQGACLMGQTNAQLLYGDPGAAKAVLEMLSKNFGFKIKMDEIEKEAKNIEEAFNALSQQLAQEQKEQPDEGKGLTYVR